jgi:hypothetical protein
MKNFRNVGKNREDLVVAGIQDLTNLEVFLTAKEVEESLQAGGVSSLRVF